MSLFKRDLTFDLAQKFISIEVWSSDFVNFTLEDRVIRTTLDNTVQDIKEIVSKRSNDVGGRLNPRCLKLTYKYRELSSYQPLSDFLVQEDHIRIQVEINKELLGPKDIRPTLLNINLKLSNGRKIALRETLHSSILSLKHSIAETLQLENGIDDVLGLEFNGGVQITDDELTIGDILHLDVAPLGDLSIYAKLNGDFECKLASPSEDVLRSYKLNATLITSIRNIKDYILEQYTGSVNVQHKDIKIIYLGRLLQEETKIYELIANAPSEGSSFILHFALKEPERKKATGGFWSEIRGGNFFEFLPREPNPAYEAEVQRDERLRDQLRDGPVQETQRPDPVLTEPEAYVEEEVIDEEESGYINGPPTLPNSAVLIGETYQNALVDNEEVYLSETDTSSTVYKVTLHGREVLLSSSQVLINDTDPSNPYLMISPSGMARLRSLGIEIEIPRITIDSNPVEIMNAVPSHDTNNNHQQHAEHQQQPQQNFPHPHINNAEPARAPAPPGFHINIDFQRVFGAFRLSIESLYNIVKYVTIYAIFIEGIQNVVHQRIATLVLVIYALTRPSNRPLLLQILSLFPTAFQERVLRFFQAPTGFTTEQVKQWFESTLRRILNVTNTERIPHIVGNTVGVIFVDILLFFTSFSPPLHAMFLRIVNEQEEARRAAEAPAIHANEPNEPNEPNDEPNAGEDAEIVEAALEDEDAPEDALEDEGPDDDEVPLLGGHRLGGGDEEQERDNDIENDIEDIEVLGERVATGAQPYGI